MRADSDVPGRVGNGWRRRNVKIQDGWLLLLQRGIHSAVGGLGRRGWRRGLKQEQVQKDEVNKGIILGTRLLLSSPAPASG